MDNCMFDLCHNKSLSGSKYCKDHKCVDESCLNLKLVLADNIFLYCQVHKCEIHHCDLIKISQSYYCEEHNCIIEGCHNFKYPHQQTCEDHA